MLRKLTILFLSFFTVAAVYGQSVGLVLSGGGAKGLYHIGFNGGSAVIAVT